MTALTLIGRLIRPVRASAARSPLAREDFDAPDTVVITSPDFADGAPMPVSSAGRGVGGNVSPEVRWTGVPAMAAALVLLFDDVDVPAPRPLFHCGAVLAGDRTGLGPGEFRSGATGVRIATTLLGRDGYTGPRPIPGHGPHHYRFHVLALDCTVADTATSVKAVLAAASGHVLARGALTGTYER